MAGLVALEGSHLHNYDLDGASLPELLDYLHSERPELRGDAACAIGDRLRTRELASLEARMQARLATLLGDPVFAVQLEAAIALSEVQDHRATAVLLQATRRRSTRLDATRALGTLGNTAAITPLQQMMRRWLLPWADRLQAAAALCALRDVDGARYLVTQLRSRRSAERAAAIHFIGETRHPDAARLLPEILSDASDPMRDVAARALGHLRAPETLPALRQALHLATQIGAAELVEDISQAIVKVSTSPHSD